MPAYAWLMAAVGAAYALVLVTSLLRTRLAQNGGRLAMSGLGIILPVLLIAATVALFVLLFNELPNPR
jgi:hypothetical protein